MSEQKQRFAIYARAATVQEHGASFALAHQIHECKEYGLAQGYAFVEDLVYQEIISGESKKRPALGELLEAAQQKKFDILVIYNYDRLARRQDVWAFLMNEFLKACVQVESVQEKLADTPVGLLAHQIAEQMEDL